MNKKLIISFDDLWEGNDRWEEFEKLHQEFPDLKITFFVITGRCSDEFLRKVNQSWTELVFHGTEHSGGWLHWSKEETIKHLRNFNENYGFVKGFKAPGWKLTPNIIEACRELNFWICSTPTIPVPVRHWYTYPQEGLRFYSDYVEFYDHIQHRHYDGQKWIEDENVFLENLEKLKEYCRSNKPDYKFISEMVK